MRRIAMLLIAATLLVPAASMAQDDENQGGGSSSLGRGRAGRSGAFGLGVQVGSPTGITGKYFLDRNLALDFGLDFTQLHAGAGIHADLLWQMGVLGRGPAIDIPFYIGVGAYAAAYRRTWKWSYWGYYYSSSDDWNLGIRVPFGLALWFKSAPIELYLEAGPRVWLAPSAIDLFADAGFRFYF